ncbi:hypothetical protein NMY22_g17829 [Coprinellus aureogranulatus]|nr:hypothetical protein NMY22_g17829 [Coprinellus aureogranulatus]
MSLLENHAQEVLTAARRVARTTRTARKKASIYISTPDSTGLADNWEQLYPNDVWKDPATYIASSTTVERSIRDGLAGGFSYFTDKRDKEWLAKDNEETRGEGTSAQGAISASDTRTSVSQWYCSRMSLNPSWVSLEKTEFLHHATGMPFPAFTEYQDAFSFATQTRLLRPSLRPSRIPQP